MAPLPHGETAGPQGPPPPASRVTPALSRARLVQTPALIVSGFGHVLSCSMFDHWPHAAREVLGELAGRWRNRLGFPNRCAFAAGVIAGFGFGHCGFLFGGG